MGYDLEKYLKAFRNSLGAVEDGITELVNNIEDVSDGYHTFDALYHQRAVLFATIVAQNPDRAWKSRRHEDGELCFGSGSWFVVGIDTPAGPYTYHYDTTYWDMFRCKELERAPRWDGHTEEDVGRLLSLARKEAPE